MKMIKKELKNIMSMSVAERKKKECKCKTNLLQLAAEGKTKTMREFERYDKE